MEQKITDTKKDYIRKIICLDKKKRILIKKLQELFSKENAASGSSHYPHNLLPFETIWQNKKYICIQMQIQQPLTQYLAEHDFSLSMLCTLAANMCQALSFLHKHHILHMDIKPDNIFLTAANEFLLGDFDSAVLLGGRQGANFFNKVHATPAYAAPELYMEGRASVQSDFYSLGKTLLSLLPENLPKKKTDNSIDRLLSLIQSLNNSSYENRPQSLHSLIPSFLELQNQVPDISYRLNLCQTFIQPYSGDTSTIYINSPRKKKILAGSIAFLPFIIISFICLLPANKLPATNKNYQTAIKHAALLPEKTQKDKEGPNAFTLPAATSKNFTSHNTVLCQTIKTLNLEEKNLMDITELQSLRTLKNLYLGNNQIVDISPLQSFSGLKKLYLNSNLITDLLPLQSMHQLEILLLQDNSIENIQPISELHNLKHLDISNNPALSDITALSDLTNLEFLNLIGTNVSEKEKRKLQMALPDCTIIR